MPDANICWLYLIRHGATANNRANPPRLQGQHIDLGLSDEGLRQAACTAEFFARRPIDAVFCSPLRRARETADAIAQGHGLPTQIVDELIEADVGQWEGLAWEEIERDYTEAYDAFMADGGVNPYLGGESVGQVQARVVPVVEQLVADNLGRTIAVVAHNVINRSYLTHVLGMPVSQYRNLPQDNCGINLLRCHAGHVKPIVVNSVFHLGEMEK